MNIFSRILEREFDQSVRLGNPLGMDSGPFLARMNAMSLMTGGRGFRLPRKGPKLSKGGSTHKQREAHLHANFLANLKAEADFRAGHASKQGWGIARINRAIERREHLKVGR